MTWELQEALEYYKGQGAPGDQLALLNLLKEIQKEQGLTMTAVNQAAEYYKIKESFLLAIIRRYPSLRLQNTHCLEICCGPNCSRRASLLDFAEKAAKGRTDLEIKSCGCMRMCGKGPNLKWDGKLYNGADEALIQSLLQQK